MDTSGRVAQLLQDGVPLALLFDLAGYGPTSAELLLEGSVDLPAAPRPHVIAPRRPVLQEVLRTA